MNSHVCIIHTFTLLGVELVHRYLQYFLSVYWGLLNPCQVSQRFPNATLDLTERFILALVVVKRRSNTHILKIVSKILRKYNTMGGGTLDSPTSPNISP